MLPGTVAMVLAAAVAHAVWNLASKYERGDALLLVCAAVSAVLHTAYSLTLQAGYERAGLGVVYPVARGTGPVLAMLFAILVLDEQLTAAAMSGASLVVAGVLVVTENPCPLVSPLICHSRPDHDRAALSIRSRGCGGHMRCPQKVW